jgi:hypothetical protein
MPEGGRGFEGRDPRKGYGKTSYGGNGAVQNSSRENVKSFQILSPKSFRLPRCLQVAELKFHVVKFEDVREMRSRVRDCSTISRLGCCVHESNARAITFPSAASATGNDVFDLDPCHSWKGAALPLPAHLGPHTLFHTPRHTYHRTPLWSPAELELLLCF